MKNILRVSSFIIVLIVLIVCIKSNSHNPLIEENKKTITEIKESRDSLFHIADTIIYQIQDKKNQKIITIENLNNEISEQKHLYDNVYLSLNQKREEIEDIKVICKKHIDIIENLEKDNKVLTSELTNYKMSFNKVKEENLIFYEEINKLKSLINNNVIVKDTIFDTIYKIDTLTYTKGEIKKLVFKKNN